MPRSSDGNVAERERRIGEEFELLQEIFPDLIHEPNGDWFLIQNDLRAVAAGWAPQPFPVAFHAQPKHPGQAPYGIYVRSDVKVRGAAPQRFKANADQKPPFPGEWGVLSWTIDGQWVPKEPAREGANLLNFVLSFEERFRSGA